MVWLVQCVRGGWWAAERTGWLIGQSTSPAQGKGSMERTECRKGWRRGAAPRTGGCVSWREACGAVAPLRHVDVVTACSGRGLDSNGLASAPPPRMQRFIPRHTARRLPCLGSGPAAPASNNRSLLNRPYDRLDPVEQLAHGLVLQCVSRAAVSGLLRMATHHALGVLCEPLPSSGGSRRILRRSLLLLLLLLLNGRCSRCQLCQAAPISRV